MSSTDDLEKFEADMELALYREYRDVFPMFSYVVETEKRFYLANGVDVRTHAEGPDTYVELNLTDAWVWDMYRSARFVSHVRILTFNDVNVEELRKSDVPDSPEGLEGEP